MTENPSNDRQDPAEVKEVETATSTEPQPLETPLQPSPTETSTDDAAGDDSSDES